VKAFLADSRIPSLAQFGDGLVIAISSLVPRESFNVPGAQGREVLIVGQPFRCYVIRNESELDQNWLSLQALIEFAKANVPNMGAHAPKMRSPTSIGTVLFPETRRKLLSILFTRADEWFYLRQLARLANTGSGAVQRELAAMSRVGLIEFRQSGRQPLFRANREAPVFRELQGLIVKTVGVADVIRNALEGNADRIRWAFIFGSFAKQQETASSDVDLFVVGHIGHSELVKMLRPVREQLSREVNVSLFGVEELRDRLAHRNHFATQVVQGPKVFLIGDEHELTRLASEWMAETAHNIS
jgi:predicted nucleotidyltransferase